MSAAQRSASRLGVRSDTLDSELLNSTSLLHTKMNNKNVYRISYLDTRYRYHCSYIMSE
jgi:hypothetical protein